MNRLTDQLQPFIFQNTQVRGALVYLDESLQTILSQHPYPDFIAHFLGEILAASALMAQTIKFNGQLVVHLENQGPLTLLSAKCTNHLEISGVAQWNTENLSGNLLHELQNGSLIITLKQELGSPYQSIVSLKYPSIAACLEAYFQQSEQLPTKFWLHADKQSAVGLLLQMMPEQSPAKKNDFNLMAAEISKSVLHAEFRKLDPTELLKTLFPEQDVELFPPRSVIFKCSCNLERVKRSLQLMPKAEMKDLLATHSEITVTCEFCKKNYVLSRTEAEELGSNEDA